MKKFILSALAVGAMAIGSAASAQDIFGLGNVLPNILGNIGLGGYGTSGSTPAVVAGAQQQVYVDQYGRRFYYDQYGRQVMLDQNSGWPQQQQYGGGRAVYDQYGRQVMLDQYGTYVDQYGRRMQVDSYGRHMPLDQYGSYRDQWGRTVYLGPDRRPLYVEQSGQVVTYGTNYGAYGGTYGGTYGGVNPRDRDGDGVRNRDDRWPDDPRYR